MIVLCSESVPALDLLPVGTSLAWIASSRIRPSQSPSGTEPQAGSMRVGDLKRAVEDVILRPEDNRLGDIGKRSTIAALDLCQYDSMGSPTSTPQSGTPRPTAAALNSCSCSGGDLASVASGANGFGVSGASSIPRSNSVQPPQLSMSSSLDTMVLRQSLSSRPSATFSRRSSRVLHHYNSKRKRSNSVSSCLNKGQPNSVSPTPSSLNPCVAIPSSANSLPPTARHTPFRFGDSVEENHHVAEAMHFENIEAEHEEHLPMLNGNGLPPAPSIPAGDPFAAYRNPAPSSCDSDIEEQMDFE
uniref:TORC_N domain-containing protein n=1 Tax=Steinernema glaseri TaxID=37863 RepID=A0A1I7ZPV1_9BILA